MSTDITKYEGSASLVAIDTSILKHNLAKVQELYRDIMVKGVHYGEAFPGSEKNSLYQTGAQLLGTLFQLAPKYKVTTTELGDGHREYKFRCRLYNRADGNFMGEGIGSCTTKEAKYRYRKAGLKCPECGKETIRRGHKDYGGGFYCKAADGGCGKKFGANDKRITSQNVAPVENPDIADVYNTVLKIGKKRSHVDAILSTVPGASGFFTQDAEDFIDAEFETEVVATEPIKPQQQRQSNNHKPSKTENHTQQPTEPQQPEEQEPAEDIAGILQHGDALALEFPENPLAAQWKKARDKHDQSGNNVKQVKAIYQALNRLADKETLKKDQSTPVKEFAEYDRSTPLVHEIEPEEII